MADPVLVDRARNGDRDAYERLAVESADRLFQVAYRIARDVDLANDAVQQTLVAMWRDLPALRDAGRFEAWTYRLVVRFALAEARRNKRRGVAVIALPADIPGADDGISQVALRDEVGRAFAALSPEHRAVLVLHHHLGLPLAEIASVLGVPYGTVGSRLHRATSQMRALLDADARASVIERVTA
jgi:RNA polymerase sigma-70 factor (ECF subfamily)